VTWNSGPGKFYLKSAQTTSSASSVPLFITPMEYKVSRTAMPDTTIRVQHNVNTENYVVSLLGTVTSVTVDPNQWVINKVVGPTKDVTLGLPEGYIINPEITITPNPNNGVFEMNSSIELKGIIEVYDITGKLVHKDIAKQNNKIDISNNAAGVYNIVIKDEKGMQLKSTKVVKE